MNTADMIDAAGRMIALVWHLRHNHYPAVPERMLPVCEAAIDFANDDDWDRLIDLPEGVLWRGRTDAPAWAIIDQLHLSAFLSDEGGDL